LLLIMSDARQSVCQLEEKVLQYSGLELNKELFVYDVEIHVKGHAYKIHTYRCGDGNAEPLVLIHGYGGSSIIFYPMLKELSKTFQVYCIDLIGMGLSSKEEFKCRSTEETLELFISSIDKWREAVGLNTFSLAGHSFGGYISGQYTRRHQDRVNKLTLLSPAGFTKYAEDPTVEEVHQKLGFLKKMFFGVFMKAWERKITPGKFLKEHPWIGKLVIRNYIYNRFNLKGPEAGLLEEFLIAMLSLPQGSEEAIHMLLKPPFANAHIPLEDIIVEDLRIPVDCFYGEFDYMDTTGAHRVDSKKMKADFNLKILPKAAHQLTMQNPKVLAQEMIISVQV